MDLITRQVPNTPNYLIVGAGRLGRHLAHYFALNKMTFATWDRRSGSVESLAAAMLACDIVLLAIPDSQIGDFYLEWKSSHKVFVHFSGTYHQSEVFGFHPLMTFGFDLYEASVYPSLYFVGTESATEFRRLFPQLPNTYQQISIADKSLYHSLCVLSGNATTLLWELVFREFAALGMDAKALKPYLQQIAANIECEADGRFTGPWYRDDKKTIQQHLSVLDGTPLAPLYKEFHDLSARI